MRLAPARPEHAPSLRSYACCTSCVTTTFSSSYSVGSCPRSSRSELADGTHVTVDARFAGLEGYLLSKCVALRARAATKDYYDFVYVLLHNRAGGPEQAARRLLDGGLANALPSLRTTLREVRERYVKTNESGPIGYAEQALEVEPDADAALLRADAVDVVQRFFAALDL
jgi:hypothetical protein